MITLQLTDASLPSKQLATFEQHFKYPLTSELSFQISHGEDYTRFFRAMGSNTSLITQDQNGVITASISVIKRQIVLANQSIPGFYLADLKILPQSSHQTLYHLFKKGLKILPELPNSSLYSCVMHGSSRTPDQYSGRLGIPKIIKLGDISIFRIESMPYQQSDSNELISLNPKQLSRLKTFSTQKDCRLDSQGSILRSEHAPRTFALNNYSASCLLEDTRKAKRLIDQNQQEIISGHISSLSYQSPAQAVKLIRATLNQTQSYPALFFAVPSQDTTAFQKLLPAHSLSGASIYGCHLPKDLRWFINTSEI
jgi:hypothetical protein